MPVAEFDCTSGPRRCSHTHRTSPTLALCSPHFHGAGSNAFPRLPVRHPVCSARQLRAGTTFSPVRGVDRAHIAGVWTARRARGGSGGAPRPAARQLAACSRSRGWWRQPLRLTDGPNNDGGSRAGTSYTSYRAQQQASSGGGASEGEDDDEEEQLPPLELLTGAASKEVAATHWTSRRCGRRRAVPLQRGRARLGASARR